MQITNYFTYEYNVTHTVLNLSKDINMQKGCFKGDKTAFITP